MSALLFLVLDDLQNKSLMSKCGLPFNLYEHLAICQKIWPAVEFKPTSDAASEVGTKINVMKNEFVLSSAISPSVETRLTETLISFGTLV